MALAEVPPPDPARRAHGRPAQWRPNPGRVDWIHALRALRRLPADKDDTSQVFEIMRALNGKTAIRGYRRLLRSSLGGKLAYERLELAPLLMDAGWLARFPKGSVGAAYRDFVEAERISAQGLAVLGATVRLTRRVERSDTARRELPPAAS